MNKIILNIADISSNKKEQINDLQSYLHCDTWFLFIPKKPIPALIVPLIIPKRPNSRSDRSPHYPEEAQFQLWSFP